MTKHEAMADKRAELAAEFGREWDNLGRKHQRAVLRDFASVDEQPELSAFEYRSRIGRGNLQAYANCQVVRYAREDS